MWHGIDRDEAWRRLSEPVDLLVVGGGSTGAAVLREAARAGVAAALVEKGDFASGTSSRSTKLAQGGLRYIATGDLKLVRHSLVERDRLVRDSGGLANPVRFSLITRGSDGVKAISLGLGVALYTLFSGRRPQLPARAETLESTLPALDATGEVFGHHYTEAPIDDSRLVLRLLQEATLAGALPVSRVKVVELVRESGVVVGAKLEDVESGRSQVVRAKAVVNATGVWADELRAGIGASPRLRPLRGSHLLFPRDRFPLAQGISWRHPRDRRFICAVPWEDVTLVGTTDHDHADALDEPTITAAEAAYLVEGVRAVFPSLNLEAADAVSAFSGVRPIIDAGEGAPSEASREHVVMQEQGLVTITGGKLTTCRAMAHDTLRALQERLPALASFDDDAPFFDRPAEVKLSSPAAQQRVQGRFGPLAAKVLDVDAADLQPIANTSTLWAEVRWAARHEAVAHLDDLMLRRVRLGLLLPNGGEAQLERIGAICREELGWDELRWQRELEAYRATWRRSYSVPVRAG